MTARSFLFPLMVVAGMLCTSVGLISCQDCGRAEAHDALVTRDAGSAMLDAAMTLDAGSAMTEHPYRPLVAETVSPPTASDPDANTVVDLWRHGALLQAIIVALYLIGGVVMKLDKRHAFYIAIGMAFITQLVPVAATGTLPTLNSVLGAVMVAWAIFVKGPSAKPAPATT